MAECKAKRSDGSACHAPAMDGTDLCFWHNPATRAARQEASRRGGGRRAVELLEAESVTPERARAILAGVIEAVASGAMDSATARTIGYLIQIEMRIREGHDLERRIAALERARDLVGV